jgi:hypothetical protein
MAKDSHAHELACLFRVQAGRFGWRRVGAMIGAATLKYQALRTGPKVRITPHKAAIATSKLAV